MKKVVLSIVLFVASSSAWAADSLAPEQRVAHIKTLVQERQTFDTSGKNSLGVAKLDSEQPSSSGLGLKMLEAMFLCLGIFFIGVYVYRKKTGATPFKRSGRIKVIDKTIVSAKTSLILAEVDGREVLLAIGGEQVSFFQPSANVSAPERLDLICQDSERLPRAVHS